MDPEVQWCVTCRDGAGRRADLAVRPESGQVVLISPTGERTVLRPLEVGRLRASLRAAAVVAEVEPTSPQ